MPSAKCMWCMFRDKAAVKSYDATQASTAPNNSDSRLDFELISGCQTLRNLLLLSKCLWLLHCMKPCGIRTHSFKKLDTREPHVLVRSVCLHMHCSLECYLNHTTYLFKSIPSILRHGPIKPTQLIHIAWRHDCILSQKVNHNLKIYEAIMNKTPNTT